MTAQDERASASEGDHWHGDLEKVRSGVGNLEDFSRERVQADGRSTDPGFGLTSPDGGLEVRRSLIPEAGLGLFATRRFNEGETLPCE